MLTNYTIAHNGHFFVQLLPAHDKRKRNLARETKRRKKSLKKCKISKGNNWASFSVFYLLKADRKKQKGAARSDDEGGAEHTKNSYVQLI